MDAPIEEVNDAITFERIGFSEIHDYSLINLRSIVMLIFCWTAELNTRAVRAVTDRQTHKTTTVTLLRKGRGLIRYCVS